jgi:DNA-binding response OmpR family regulator
MANILVVDDEDRMAAFIASLLKKDGHEVQRANHGVKALEMLGVKHAAEGDLPDLIVLDVMMPEVDGYEVARILNDTDSTSSIPILMLTGKGQPSETVEMTPNIKLYLEKPFDPHNFLDMVAAIIGDSGKSAPPPEA